MDFFEMPVEDSRRFCELTRVRGPVKLAWWLRADGVDLRQLDGSLGSLVPLWEWAVGFIDRGCPGVPPQALPSVYRPGPWDQRGQDHASRWRALYVGEALVAYLAAVASRVDPAGGWAVFETRQNDSNRNETQWRNSSGAWRALRNTLTSTVGVVEGEERDRRPTYLVEFINVPYFMTPDMVALAERPGPSVLEGLPPAPTTPLPPFWDLGPDEGGPLNPPPGQPGAPKPEDPGTQTEPLWLARGQTRWLSHHPDRLNALDTQAVTDAIQEMGFTETSETAALPPSTGGAITRTTWTPDLGVRDHELSNARTDATLAIAIEGGAIRSLCLELHYTPPDVATTTLDRYRALATQLGATITPDSKTDDNDEGD